MQSDMTSVEPCLRALGDCAWTLEFGQTIDSAVNARCHELARRVREQIATGALHGVQDIVPTFRSVTVFFDAMLVDAARLGEALLQLAQCSVAQASKGRRWHLPVHFGGERSADLAWVAQQTGCSQAQVIASLTQTTLRVHAMGFMPGFAYMAELPAKLQLPRRATPRTAVAPQTLAIANAMACVYPWASPGGWHLLGHMPVQLFDLREPDQPALLRASDQVTFYAVDEAEARSLLQAQSADKAFRWRFCESVQP